MPQNHLRGKQGKTRILKVMRTILLFVAILAYSILPSLYEAGGNSEDSGSASILFAPSSFGAAGPLLPDLIVDESTTGIGTWFVEDNFLRLSMATANIGNGPLEIRGGTLFADGTREVYQRIYNGDGSYTDVPAGRFVHDSHPHIHFEEYAQFNLRALTTGGGVGDTIVAGTKVSFCLIDSQPYLTGAPAQRYFECPEAYQGISPGWEDIYDYTLECQYIDLSGVPAGDYWLEGIVDYAGRLRELNDSNNLARVMVTVPTTVTQNDAGGGRDAGCGYSSALSILPNTVYAGEIRGGADHAGDWYSFEVQAGQNITVTLTPPADADFDLMIYDSTRNDVARSSLSTGQTERLTVTAEVGGTWGTNVAWVSGGGSYGFQLDLSPSQNDAGSGADAGDSFTTATSIAVNTVYQAQIVGSWDAQDWYQFPAMSGLPVTVSMTSPTASDFDLELYDPDGQLRANSTLANGETDTINYTTDVTGSWRIRIYQYSGTGHYSFSVTHASAQSLPLIPIALFSLAAGSLVAFRKIWRRNHKVTPAPKNLLLRAV